MRIGIFADAHDHLDNIRLAVERFNAEQVEVVLFAGDIVSTIAVPPLKRLKCKVVACFGDNEGNKIGLRSGFSLVGTIDEAPVRYTANDGTRIVIVHMKRQLRGLAEEFDIQVVGHTHKARIEREENGRLLINPGETSGWSFGRPTIAVLETTTREVRIIDLLPVAQVNQPAAISS
jgi:putative phosphoesterase